MSEVWLGLGVEPGGQGQRIMTGESENGDRDEGGGGTRMGVAGIGLGD